MHLPTPPNNVEKWLYLFQSRKTYYGFSIVSFLALMIGMSLFAVLKVEFHFYIIYLVLFGGYISVSYFIGVIGRDFNLLDHIRIKATSIPILPTVDVFLPTCGEPIQLLKNTFKYAAKLLWPKDSLNIYVLDDRGRKDVLEASLEYGFKYISRPNKGELQKAGNLRHAFSQTSGEFILILDADFAPRQDMLTEMTPYMNDPEIGIVQSPQFFDVIADTNWLERSAAAIQILFYKLVQVSRDSHGAAICVGSCGLYRRKTLEPHGGSYPIGYSEDVHTGMQAMADGWKIKYIPVPLAKGVCPENLRGFFNQQIRWCTGSLALCTNPMFWRAKISFMQRACYLSGFCYYVLTGLSVLFIPLCPIMMVWHAPEFVFWWNMLYYLPSFLFSVVFLPLWMSIKIGYSTEMIQARQVSYWAHLFALIDKVTGNPMTWVPTNAKVKADLRYKAFGLLFVLVSGAWWFLVLAGLYVNWKEIGLFHTIPHLIFSTFYATCNVSILEKYKEDNK